MLGTVVHALHSSCARITAETSITFAFTKQVVAFSVAVAVLWATFQLAFITSPPIATFALCIFTFTMPCTNYTICSHTTASVD